MDRIIKIINQGGPITGDYELLNYMIAQMDDMKSEQQDQVLKILQPVLSLKTIQGHAYLKPYGYAGDFHLIDKIYTNWTSQDEDLKRWDEFFHTQAGAKAVRNRKEYFIRLVHQMEQLRKMQMQESTKILNIGSGPGRDVKEYFDLYPNSNAMIECADLDQNAIDYAQELCSEHLDRVHFINKNIFRFKPKSQFDLIWSAGLFDYFSDRQFIMLIRQLRNYVKKGGEIVIGNFSTEHPSRVYMEKIGHWYLEHRSKEKLKELAILAGANEESVSVSQEKEGVNLFLHIAN